MIAGQFLGIDSYSGLMNTVYQAASKPDSPFYRTIIRKGDSMPSNTSCRFKRLVIVAYRLPVSIVVEDGKSTIRQNSGGLVSAMAALSEKMSGSETAELFKNVAWAGKGDDIPSTGRVDTGLLKGLIDKYILRGNRKDEPLVNLTKEGNIKYQLFPVTIPPEIDAKYYGGFCNDCIWPLFHYLPSQAANDESYFESYVTANRLFADKLKSIVQPDDFVWIHDYQLFLLPGMLRDLLPNANIGFFLHIPFPAFEIFRVIPRHWRDAILKGMLGADIIGFHTNDYSQYFLRSASRLLGYETTMNSIVADGRLVRVDAFPIGIDYEKFNNAAANSREVRAEEEKVLAMLGDKKLIFSVDRLDYTKGLPSRLEAFDYFVETHPEWKEKIIFNMVVIPSREAIPQYQIMKREVEAIVGRINGKYSTLSWRPIIYQYKSLSFNELVALYDISHIGLITPMRDGMNLVAKEYIACQEREKGVLILSEMAGAASELSEAILVNPINKMEVAGAIHKALTMPLRDRTVFLRRMQKRLKNYTVFSWANDFLASLESVKKEQAVRKVNLITPAIESKITAQFAHASKRAIFIDYDGTLVPFSKVPELATPDTFTLDQLKTLAANPKNTIILISGRDKTFLDEWFGNVNIHLIAEHGAFQKPPDGSWQCTIDQDQTWKATFLPILQRYTDHCIGSFIEEKSSSLSWHYRNSPQETGAVYSKELKEEIRALFAHENKLHILEGNLVIELKKTGYNKGTAASKFISNESFECIVAFGDDRTDEDLFQSLPPETVSIKIGLTTSVAKYNLANQRDVSRVIGHLIDNG